MNRAQGAFFIMLLLELTGWALGPSATWLLRLRIDEEAGRDAGGMIFCGGEEVGRDAGGMIFCGGEEAGRDAGGTILCGEEEAGRSAGGMISELREGKRR